MRAALAGLPAGVEFAARGLALRRLGGFRFGAALLDHSHREELPDALNDMAARLSHRAYTLHHDGEQLQARARLLQDELERDDFISVHILRWRSSFHIRFLRSGQVF